jgi:hypothetical protein
MLYVMLAGAYPFERPEDKGDPQKLQRMIQRILRVEYALPAALRPSAPLADLLSRLLVADPAQVHLLVLGLGLGGWFVGVVGVGGCFVWVCLGPEMRARARARCARFGF